MQAALSLVAYVGTSPQTDPCLTGQPATRLRAREYARGNSLLLDTDGVTPVESVFAAEGGVGVELVALDGANGERQRRLSTICGSRSPRERPAR